MAPNESTRNLDPLTHLLQETHRPDLDLYMVLSGLRDALLGYRRSSWKDASYQRSFEAAKQAGLGGLCSSSEHPVSPMCTLLGCHHENGPDRVEEVAAESRAS